MSRAALTSVVFRADASTRIASGHVMRCLTLADALSANGIQTVFICRDLPGNLFEVIRQRGHRLIALSAPDHDPTRETDHHDDAANLGVAWEEDAQETSEAIRRSAMKPDWLIVDHYALDRRWESRLRDSTKKIFVIDDIAKRPHECDLLLNENVLPDLNASYHGLVPRTTRLLLGPTYALVRPEFRAARRHIRPRDGMVQRLLVCYGGVDFTNETGKALEALASLHRPDRHVDVVVGSANPHQETIHTTIQRRSGITLHVQLPHLAHLMSQVDLALSAGGSTIWELLLLGVPTFVTTTADHQVPTVRYLHERGFVRWLGSAREVGMQRLQDALRDMLEHPEWLCRLSQAGWDLIDGRGSERIAGALDVSTEEEDDHAEDGVG